MKESMYKNIREKVVIDLRDCVRIVMGILVRNHWQSNLSLCMGFSDFLLRNWCLIGLVINRRRLIRIFKNIDSHSFPVLEIGFHTITGEESCEKVVVLVIGEEAHSRKLS
ncbi:hypothetical protein CDAR_232121 [Caerostris darwini]|uniref:Uncharacterized protein n=1 Tax=Caerostris darwini TaxID=1538125 RepID=A0AAV4U9K1_9ARAC|nr:hypothetical protein CDAR_232121 [Caerostris darwini]